MSATASAASASTPSPRSASGIFTSGTTSASIAASASSLNSLSPVAFSFAVVDIAFICVSSPIRASSEWSPSAAASRATMNGSWPPSTVVAIWLSSSSCWLT